MLMMAVQPVLAVDPPHLSDGDTGTDDCSLCHTLHDAPGGALTNAAGNANLCQSCHVVGGTAELYALTESDQALPGPGLPDGVSPGGTSHRWDSGPGGHVALGTPNTSTGTIQSGGDFTGRFAKTYTITITTAGDSDSAVFSWVDTHGGGEPTNAAGADVALGLEGVTVTFTDGESSPSFELGDQWYVHVLTDLNTPSDPSMQARLEDGKIMCSTCHHQHSQELTPFDPDAPAYGGAGTGYQCVGGADDGLPCDGGCPGGECRGRHFQRINNENAEMCLDCHSTRDVGSLASQGEANLSHPVGVPIPGGDYQAPSSLPLDASSNVACLSCHDMHDPGGFKGLPDDGTLLRLASTSLCEECHTLAGVGASHLNTDTGVLWPGGEYGSTFPEITDTAKRGSCVNCHQPHGYPDDATPSQDYASLLVENASADICFTCHDANGPSAFDVYTQFNGVTNYQVDAYDNALVNQRHDVSAADQTYSGGVVACADCHNPHLATPAEKVIDPDNKTVAYASTYDKTNSYTRDTYNFSYQFDDTGDTDLDPMNPIGCAAQPASVGPAVEGVHNGDDLGTSGGIYTGTENQTYTVTISTGGAPGSGAAITVTSTGADSSGPTPVTAFDTPVVVGTLGVSISFADGGSGGTPGTVGPAVDPPPANDDTAVSGGTYAGTADGTYTVTVTNGGRARDVIIECTGLDCGGGTIVCQPSGSGGPQCAYDSPFDVGSNGVNITISDAGARDFVTGDDWTIAVTGPSGDTVLTAGDTWTIDATAATAGCDTAPEPDMITFCLVCHDEDGTIDPPDAPPGVTMSPNLVNIAAAYRDNDQHGRLDGTGGGNGLMKAPWQDIVANGDGTWANAELDFPYAALQCNTCHDGHGSDNIYHLKTSITVRGQVMSVGGGPGSGLEASPFTAASDHSPGDTEYFLPCFIGNTQVSCSEPGSTQDTLKWGAWCTFCHDMQTHGQTEDVTCRTGHRHGAGAF
jgi:predicted CXXCH cytochrome family protein